MVTGQKCHQGGGQITRMATLVRLTLKFWRSLPDTATYGKPLRLRPIIVMLSRPCGRHPQRLQS
jgi:hypothetical protein